MKYHKSEAGQLALKDRSLLTPRQRSAFILFDGNRDLAAVLQATASMGVTTEDIDHLIGLGFLVPLVAQETQAQVDVREAKATKLTGQERYKKAYPIAAQLTSGLGLRGFRLNLAVEGAGDLDALLALLPAIREAVGPAKAEALEQALRD
ncbi:MAG TPA: hypothetical protein VE934_04590 [Polaromonas sp.]|uniref:hypothetical protein n=1 Tax=Polaromonas sp. TaxID=1869339 RepID=UPI002D25BB68|nr:hypothetical protein [Polaromonas sp.]HYW56213.1 hypothetical protein [Polaromonas sp.]